MTLPPGKPRLLVVGGTGQALASPVKFFRDQGYDVVVVGRRPGPSKLQQRYLFDGAGARYQSIDVLSRQGQDSLRRLAEQSDVVIMGGEPHYGASAESTATREGMSRFYETLRSAGYSVEENKRRTTEGKWPKRVVRVGSPPAERPYGREASAADLRRLVATDPSWDNPYFRGKVLRVEEAEEATRNGLDLVTALPTGVVSAFGDYGAKDPLVLFQKGFAGVAPQFTPSTPTNLVTGEDVGRGLLLAALAGDTGRSYQLAGSDVPSHLSLQSVLESTGQRLPPVRHFSTSDLDYQLGLARGDSFERTSRDVADYSGRAVTNLALMTNPLTFLWGATKAGLDTVTGSVQAVKNVCDNTASMAIRAAGIEDWQLALLRLMQSRRSDVRALNDRISDPRFAHARYRSDEQIRQALPEAYRQRARWLQERGLLGGKTVNVDLAASSESRS
ncbi:MAG: hypothetical protein ACT4TC_06155 [Myxococcaceae bacterium]